MSAKNSKLKTGAWAVLPAAFYLFLYWRRLLLFGFMPFDGDTFRLVYPTWVVGRRLLAQGHLLWDPYRNMGLPFLASPPNQALYPLRLLSLITDFLNYQRIYVVFHTMILCGFSYALVWRQKRSHAASVFAALAMGFNGFVFSRVTTNIDFSSMAWVPAILFFLSMKKPVGAAVSLAIQWLAGFPPFFILTVGLSGVYCCTRPEPGKMIRFWAAGVILAAGLAAIQWVPFLEMMGQSSRPLFLNAAAAVLYSIHPLEMARSLFLPSFYLNRLSPVTTADVAVTGFYLGPLVMLLFVFGFIRSSRAEKALGAVGCAALLLSLGKYNGFYENLPFITVFRFPAHWLLVAVPCLVLVAVEGLAGIKNRPAQWAIVILVAADLFLYATPDRLAWGDLTFIAQAPERVQKVGALAEGERLFHEARITEYIHTWPVRTKEDWLSILGFYAPSIGVAHGVYEADSRHQLGSVRHEAYVRRLQESPLTSPLYDYARVGKIVLLNAPGVPSTVPSLQDVRVVENKGVKPRAFSIGGEAAVKQDGVSDVRIEAAGPGTVVLSEAFYPGWHATVNGRRAPIKLFENFFISCDIPAGKSAVRFKYWPFSFVLGAVMSALSLAVLLFLIGRRYWVSGGDRFHKRGRGGQTGKPRHKNAGEGQ